MESEPGKPLAKFGHTSKCADICLVENQLISTGDDYQIVFHPLNDF